MKKKKKKVNVYFCDLNWRYANFLVQGNVDSVIFVVIDTLLLDTPHSNKL